METLREISKSLLSISQGDVSVYERATSLFADTWSPTLANVPSDNAGTERRFTPIVLHK
jgi:hypothetical protein